MISACEKWYEIGLFLKVCVGTLDAIQVQFPNQSVMCLHKTLEHWLKAAVSPLPTWSDVLNSLKSKVVGENRLALQLESKLCEVSIPKKIYVSVPSQKQADREDKTQTSSTEVTLKQSTSAATTIPERIQIKIYDGNELPFHRVVAVSETFKKFPDLTHTTSLRKEEQFCPVLQLIDCATNQPLNCTVVLHPSDVEIVIGSVCCSISVSVTGSYAGKAVPGPDSYHVQKNTSMNNRGELSLQFCFFHPDTEYAIKFGIHSITDTEGLECIGYTAEEYKCIVHTTGQNSLGVRETARRSNPPLLQFTGSLQGKTFERMNQKFVALLVANNAQQIDKVTKHLMQAKDVTIDCQIVGLGYQALSKMRRKEQVAQAQTILDQALELTYKEDCKNGILLRGRILRLRAQTLRYQGHHDEAREQIKGAKVALFCCQPSYDTSNLIAEEGAILAEVYKENMSDIQKREIERLWEQGIAHSDYCYKDYEQPVSVAIYTRKAMFHLGSPWRTPCSEQKPTADDLQMAESVLEAARVNDKLGDVSIYKIDYYFALSILHRWKQNYRDAIAFTDAAIHQCTASNTNKTDLLDKHRQMLTRLESEYRLEQEGVQPSLENLLDQLADCEFDTDEEA